MDQGECYDMHSHSWQDKEENIKDIAPKAEHTPSEVVDSYCCDRASNCLSSRLNASRSVCEPEANVHSPV